MLAKIFFPMAVGLLFLLSYPCSGQEKEECMEIIINTAVNNDGSAATFKTFCGKEQYVVLKHLINEWDYRFIGKNYKTELNDRFFFALDKVSKNLYRVNLENAKVDTLSNTSDFDVLAEDVFFTVSDVSVNKISFYNNERLINVFQNHPKLLSISNDRKKVISVSDGNDIDVFNICNKKLHHKKMKLNSTNYLQVKRVVWSNYDNECYLFATDKSYFSIYKFIGENVTPVFRHDVLDSQKKTVIDTLFREITFLTDKKIAVGIKNAGVNTVKKAAYDVWDTADNFSLNDKKMIMTNKMHLGILDLKTQTIKRFFSNQMVRDYRINKNTGEIYFMVYDQETVDTKHNPDIEFFKVDSTKAVEKSLGTFKGRSNIFYSDIILPFLLYFEKGELILFDTGKNSKERIMIDTVPSLVDTENLNWNDESGSHFFSYEKKYLYFVFNNDVYSFNTKIKRLKRLTNSKFSGFKYAISKSNYSSQLVAWEFNGGSQLRYADILLTFSNEDGSKNGLAVIKGERLIELYKDSVKISKVVRSERFITFTTEKSNRPPLLKVMDMEKKNLKELYQSNKKHLTDTTGKSEYISWVNEDGFKRGVIVRFPKKYDPAKKYATIFNVYERKYPEQHNYQCVYDLSAGGFTNSLYTNDEYFVVEPDIYYKLGKPGFSAFQCVMEVLAELEKRYSIDVDRLGIFGHSFGGYETNFIITQTNRFKAAVSGSGVADLTSWYLTVDWNSRKPSMWRLENYQFRMNSSLFENYQGYLDNSPVYHSENIETPLLLWAGQKDYNVDWQQSVTMYLAMKRQHKKAELLLYPVESHVINDHLYKKDLNIKVKNWFDYYLKGSLSLH